MNARAKAPLQWEHGRFVVERACTCRLKVPECAELGFHVVQGQDDAFDALDTASGCQEATGVTHRVRDLATGEVLS